MTAPIWDCVIRNALVFDGSGSPPRRFDLAVRDGRVAAHGIALAPELATEVVEADGHWLLPGLLDIHTHLDLEVEVDPRLPEAVRHGTTTVVVGNCSLGTCFGAQRSGDQDPIVDCFTRVENIPKPVLARCADAIAWNDTGAYLDHFGNIPLGPNVAAFVPHSMLRIEVMGLEASISRPPTTTELADMCRLLGEALDQGYLGLSTDGLPFHYLANEPHTDRRIPTQFADYREMKRLLQVVRERDRVWQTTPLLDTRLNAFRYFTLTSGLLHGRPLKTSALSALEFALMPRGSHVFLAFARLMNSRLFRGAIHFQALGTNFRVWADGIVSPLYEELPSTSRLIAKEYGDRAGRLALLNDPAWIEEFRRDWTHGRRGWTLAHLKAKLGLPENLVPRELEMLVFDGAPVPEWDGENMQQVFERLLGFQGGDTALARSGAEADAFEKFPRPTTDEVDFMLTLMREYDKAFRYWVDVANVRNRATLDLLLHDNTLPGFNDSGAHMTNMAFFDANLNALKLAQARGLETVARMVQRLTSKPAELFGLDAGSLAIGARADLVLIDPDHLAAHDCDARRSFEHREIFDHQQMVNRSDGVVKRVLINGRTVWRDTDFSPDYGAQPVGEALRAGTPTAR